MGRPTVRFAWVLGLASLLLTARTGALAWTLGSDANVGGCGIANTGELTVGGDFVCGIPVEQLEGLVRDRTKLLEDRTADQKHVIALLQDKLQLSERQLRAAFEATGEAEVPPEQIAGELVKIAGRYKALGEDARPAPDDNPRITELKAQLKEAIAQAKLERAEKIRDVLDAAVSKAIEDPWRWYQ